MTSAQNQQAVADAIARAKKVCDDELQLYIAFYRTLTQIAERLGAVKRPAPDEEEQEMKRLNVGGEFFGRLPCAFFRCWVLKTRSSSLADSYKRRSKGLKHL